MQLRSQQLTSLLYSDPQKRREAWNWVEKAIGTQDNWKLPEIYQNLNREERYDLGLREGKVMLDDELKYSHDYFYYRTHRHQLGNCYPFGLTTTFFILCIKLLGTDQQASEWIPRALRGEVFGAYIQTEIGHGTFLQGIETTATFDVDTGLL